MCHTSRKLGHFCYESFVFITPIDYSLVFIHQGFLYISEYSELNQNVYIYNQKFNLSSVKGNSSPSGASQKYGIHHPPQADTEDFLLCDSTVLLGVLCGNGFIEFLIYEGGGKGNSNGAV